MFIKPIIALSILTLVHSWYPQECCHDKDCKPVPCEELLDDPKDGSVKYKQYTFSQDKVKLSPDKECHVCINSANNPVCVFIHAGV